MASSCSFCGEEAWYELGLPSVKGAWAHACKPCYLILEEAAQQDTSLDLRDLSRFEDAC